MMTLITNENVSLEVAEGIVKTQKELIEKLTPPPPDPKVKNAGGSKGGNEDHDISDEDLAEAVMNA